MEKPLLFFGGCLPALGSHADVILVAVVVPKAVDIVTACDTDNSHVLARLHFTDYLEKWNDRRPNLVPACGHHPLLDIRSGDARYAAVIFDAKKDHPAAKVRECDKLLFEVVVLQHVALKFDPGVLSVIDDFQKLGVCHHASESIF